jgi:dTDP-L-rhamnose 4-epimerase
MKTRVLITGGAGFIGSHLADELLGHGYEVSVLDNLLPQVHGGEAQPPAYLSERVHFIRGDVRDRATVAAALKKADAVFHFAAAVGVGQSMYEISKYTDINAVGTSVLLEALLEHPVHKLVIASSMSVYGEGLYQGPGGAVVADACRPLDSLRQSRWEPLDAAGAPLAPVATPESKPPMLASVYALSKYMQERMCLMIGQTYRIPTVALRFFNVYGTRQALSNPYTGVLAIFASRFLNGKPPLIFEDGHQRRDFVSVYDVAAGCRLALESDCSGEVFNLGSGQSASILQVARMMAEVLGKTHLSPQVCGKYRVGDIRHCFADISKARRLLGYRPQVSLSQGMVELAGWLATQNAQDQVDAVNADLAQRGLTV